MREDYLLPFRSLQLQLDGHAGQGDDLAGGIAQHVCPQDGVVLGQDELTEAVHALVLGYEAAAIGHRQLDYAAGDAFPLQ